MVFLKIWQSSLFFDHQNRVLATVKDECFFNSVIGHNQFVATICFILHCYMLYVIQEYVCNSFTNTCLGKLIISHPKSFALKQMLRKTLFHDMSTKYGGLNPIQEQYVCHKIVFNKGCRNDENCPNLALIICSSLYVS